MHNPPEAYRLVLMASLQHGSKEVLRCSSRGRLGGYKRKDYLLVGPPATSISRNRPTLWAW